VANPPSPGDPDALADHHSGYTGAQQIDDADNFMPRNDGIADFRQFAVD